MAGWKDDAARASVALRDGGLAHQKMRSQDRCRRRIKPARVGANLCHEFGIC